MGSLLVTIDTSGGISFFNEKIKTMNWYSVFYWVAVADGVKDFFDSFSNIFTTFSVITLIAMTVLIFCKSSSIDSRGIKNDEDEKTDPEVRSFQKAINMIKPMFYTFLVLSVITWMGYVFTPSKKDAVMIIAGGAVGNFITSDSSAKGIPAELTLLVREKMKSEIKELKAPNIGNTVDTLAGKSKEELIELLKRKQ